MTPASIRDGFAKLRSDEQMQPLADAAVCRSESDWLVGINGTRAMTAFNSKAGGFQLTTVGRVQTPTLAILVEREEKIRAFVPRNYWEVLGTFRAAAGEYTGTLVRREVHEAATTTRTRAPSASGTRRGARAIADAVPRQAGHRHRGNEAVDADRAAALRPDQPAARSQRPLRLLRAHDAVARAGALREAQGAHLSAHRFARAARGLHRHGRARRSRCSARSNAYGTLARKVLKKKWVRPNKRIFDNSKISDHFAIIPTLQAPKHLTEAEQKLYDLVVKRFLAVFYPAAEFQVTTRITRVEGEPFKTEGKVLVEPGWLAVYGKEAARRRGRRRSRRCKPDETVDDREGRRRRARRRDRRRATTKRTLLSAMEGAGKLIEDDELREAMREKGLGTPATRAQIIEGLIPERYIYREGQELVPTAKAFSLMTLLHGLGVPELFSPELTARVGVQAGADGARQARARRVHARDRRA